MHRISAAVVVALAGVVALVSLGCVDEAKYNAVLLRNREQEKLLQEKESQLATLNERVSALQARATDAQRLLAENVSNADTPKFQPRDLTPPDFKRDRKSVV